jgi:hypothetical protein
VQKTRITHLSLTSEQRRAAGIRAAQLGLSLTAYVAELIAADAERAGVAALAKLAAPSGEEVARG